MRSLFEIAPPSDRRLGRRGAATRAADPAACRLAGAGCAAAPFTAAALVAATFAAALRAEPAGEGPRSGAEVRDVSPDWMPAERRQIPVVAAEASSFLAADGDTYAPRRAADGDRRTKWVASELASEAAPQWITLRLPGAHEVSGVALFGEAPGNDGVRDARVEVSSGDDGSFAVVARVEDARSAAWVAGFEPVRTSAVRLVVTRSGGASTHTDVWEILVLGSPMSSEELERWVADRLRACRELLERLRTAGGAPRPDAPDSSLPPEPGAASETDVSRPSAVQPSPLDLVARRCEDLLSGLEGRLASWISLGAPERLAVAEEAERLHGTLGRAAAVAERAAAALRSRSAEIDAARAAARRLGGGEGAVAARENGRALLATGRIVVSIDEATGNLDATWLRLDGAVRGAGMEIEIDGSRSTPAGAAARIEPCDGALGAGIAVRQTWGSGVEIERFVRVHDAWPLVVVGGSVTNRTDRDVSLGEVRLIDVSPAAGGWWFAGSVLESPAAVLIAGISELLCEPAAPAGGDLREDERRYAGTSVLALGHRRAGAGGAPGGAAAGGGALGGLVIGFLRAREARPDVEALFLPGVGGTALSARQRFLGRVLRAGETLALDPVALSASATFHDALELYGDAVAASSSLPVRRGANSLWCSWYAHRMAMTEDLVLANAAAAARHFHPLGMDVIQLDHGWQRGDITGDWRPNERFPHGLAWLAEELRSRHGMALGAWISPTDVAETSETFREHPEWALKDEAGRPRVNWRWYWKPNPDCYELDASRPDAAEFIEETFSRLAREGVSYFKIDFIAPAAGEHFVQADPCVTRGWGVLARAMEAVRRGAGERSWIRYCQTPPLLSVGLADSAYGGSDTLDAGLGGDIGVLRTNARSLAAGWWIQDRLYHREVCDMSVRMQAPVEEVRMRLALMTLAGCSISFSDELRFLPPSRILLMQKCLPPGCPPMRP
ncbi:MAG: alpha-galactosidase, partial [Planctomycetes bacterium]|nr:alpha-galactosidase [Planctomycetota bacterium]